VIDEIKCEKLKTPIKVYNFEVEDFHTYFVSDLEVLVHNKAMRNANPIAKRYQFKTRKKAFEAAKKAGKGKKPISHKDKNGEHFHPNVKMPKNNTPKAVSPHDHYYY
jgi:hypothetical protein